MSTPEDPPDRPSDHRGRRAHRHVVARYYEEYEDAAAGARADRRAGAAAESALRWSRCPCGKLAQKLKCEPSNVTGIVDRLEARGLVERRPDPADRRVKLAAATEEGRRVARGDCGTPCGSRASRLPGCRGRSGWRCGGCFCGCSTAPPGWVDRAVRSPRAGGGYRAVPRAPSPGPCPGPTRARAVPRARARGSAVARDGPTRVARAVPRAPRRPVPEPVRHVTVGLGKTGLCHVTARRWLLAQFPAPLTGAGRS